MKRSTTCAPARFWLRRGLKLAVTQRGGPIKPVKLTTRLTQGPQTGIGSIRVPGYAPLYRLEDTY
jgi:hypothetical protein